MNECMNSVLPFWGAFLKKKFWPHLTICGISSLTRISTCTPCIGRQSLSHWATKEVPLGSFLFENPLRPNVYDLQKARTFV